jgi:hypothetical protein
MKKIILLISITLFSWIGWMICARFGIMTAYIASFVGSLIGVYVGCKINSNYLS